MARVRKQYAFYFFIPTLLGISLVPDIAPDLIVTTVVLDICLIP
jgi:hypothetical protein